MCCWVSPSVASISICEKTISYRRGCVRQTSLCTAAAAEAGAHSSSRQSTCKNAVAHGVVAHGLGCFFCCSRNRLLVNRPASRYTLLRNGPRGAAIFNIYTQFAMNPSPRRSQPVGIICTATETREGTAVVLRPRFRSSGVCIQVYSSIIIISYDTRYIRTA